MVCADPGFGKTPTLIALVLSHPRAQQLASHATLVVVPNSLVAQWKDEITKAVLAGHELLVCEHETKMDDDAFSRLLTSSEAAQITITTPSRIRADPRLKSVRWWRIIFSRSMLSFVEAAQTRYRYRRCAKRRNAGML